ncbi:hypothetical protein SAMN04488693_11945 [Arthrobacter subterraneus]|uniref:Uncharacterized protein n=1 Tax=Arthrobacter subterraneus TaxID=335973 RepID=A0A1G8MS35_9MICC|nr:hypothetical protein SAMN04488693_11945 [Arthrobacter subterraneus]
MDAMVKFATAEPEGVKRSSGSAVRFPMTVMVVSPAMMINLPFVVVVVLSLNNRWMLGLAGVEFDDVADLGGIQS